MTYRRNINVEPAAALRELISGLVDQQDQSRTNAHGIKHMGVDGDTRWTRPDGSEHSVRDLDEIMDQTRAEIAEAIANIEELNNVTLPELWEKLGQLEVVRRNVPPSWNLSSNNSWSRAQQWSGTTDWRRTARRPAHRDGGRGAEVRGLGEAQAVPAA